jgi:HEAT repeat protein
VLANRALEKLGQDPAVAVPALIRALKDPVGPVRLAAMGRLGRIGPRAKEAVPALLDYPSINSTSITRQDIKIYYPDRTQELSSVYAASDDAILKIGKPAVPYLVAALKDQDKRADVIQLLGRFGPEAKEAVPELVLLTQSTSFGQYAIEALKKIDPKSLKKR